ncbi:MAG: Gfo/Idh/MocA family oxidoreductase [Clostridia bacterium]|nr:Gfo/Idh/MocA family oxidoreductase [Clostridia bacterium]
MKKLAMIGCGGIGQYHLNHFLKFPDIELAGFCDLVAGRAEDFVRQAGGQAFTDFRKMYDDINPDMVFICVPPYAHGDIEMETIQRKIPFFVEKPVALDLKLAIKIRDAISDAGLITAVGFQCRYSNLVEPTRQFILHNEVPFIQCARIGGVPDVPWWKNKALSGGQIVEQTIHQFDLIRAVYGEPVQVFTMSTRGFIREIQDYDTDDLSVSAIRFQNGALAAIATGCYALDAAASDSKMTFGSRRSRLDHYLLERVDLYGEKEKDDFQTNEGLVVKGDGTLSAASDQPNQTVKDDGQAGILCDRTFIDAVISNDGSRIRSPYADAVLSLAFTLACNRSMETGLPVDLDRFN